MNSLGRDTHNNQLKAYSSLYKHWYICQCNYNLTINLNQPLRCYEINVGKTGCPRLFLIRKIFVSEQKWSKGKVRDKLNNLVLFDKATYEKLYKEVPNYKLITPAVVSERLKIRGSLARNALQELLFKGEYHWQHAYIRINKLNI